MIYTELRSYKETHGHTSVPSREGFLGQWTNDQRRCYKKKRRGEKTHNLSDEREKALSQLGFDWTPSRWNTAPSSKWQTLESKYKANKSRKQPSRASAVRKERACSVSEEVVDERSKKEVVASEPVKLKAEKNTGDYESRETWKKSMICIHEGCYNLPDKKRMCMKHFRESGIGIGEKAGATWWEEKWYMYLDGK